MDEEKRDTLFKLREMVKSTVGGRHVIAKAEAWAKEQASTWPYGIYSPNDLTSMFESGYYRGWLAGAASAHESATAADWNSTT